LTSPASGPLAGTVEATTVSVFNGPMKVVAALAAPVRIPLPTSSPAVAVITTATAAAGRRIGFLGVCSLSPASDRKKLSPSLTTWRAGG